MLPSDKEDEERIALHRKNRAGLGFKTVEIPSDIKRLADTCATDGTVLIDSVTALLANEMFTGGGNVNENAAGKICDGLSEVFLKIKNVVVVSDFIYADGLLYDEFTEKYRAGLASVDRFCAGECDAAVEAFAGNFIIYKGKEALDEIFNKIG